LGEYEMAEKLEREHWKLWRRWLEVMGTKLRMETNAETVTGCGFAEAFSAKQICQASQSVRHLGQVA